MTTIYASASQVVVWLGDSPDVNDDRYVQITSIETAFETIRECAHSNRSIPNSMPSNVGGLLRQNWFS
jgi:hypothetical protein